MAIIKLALILKNPSDESQFLICKQNSPPKFGDQEYDSYVDSDLWDLPSTQLKLLEGDSVSEISVEGLEACPETIDLWKLDIVNAINRSLEDVGLAATDGGEWKFWKYVEEPEFGPSPSINTLYVTGNLFARDGSSLEFCKWISSQICRAWLLEKKPSNSRVGPLVVVGILNDLKPPANWIPPRLHYQEYPPGIALVPMGSRTGRPFRTTNLIVFAPECISDCSGNSSFVVSGDALIVDPGCLPEYHQELAEIVSALPRKLVVFLTHHHRDHVDGLSVVQKCNPDAILVAHDNTMHRVSKGDWSLGHTAVSGEEYICIGGQRWRVIFSPGHTDGHTALLHVNTHSLIVGDHCVGQGSAVLDITSGGNMTDYFQSTYKFLELSPHVLIPMHGRVNLWPKHMLCAYLKNRRSREASILKAIENGAETLFDIVADVYSDVDRIVWINAASNVRLHVHHLAGQDKLPKAFSLETFTSSLVSFRDKLDNL